MAKQEAVNKPKNWQVGTLRKKGEKLFLVLDEKVRILVGDQEVDAGEFRTLHFKLPAEVKTDMDFKIDKGWLTAEDAEKQLQYMEDKNVRGVLQCKLK